MSATTPEPTAYLSVAAVAERLSVHPSTIRRLVDEGDLEAINVARYGRPKLRIPTTSLDAYVASRAITRA